MVMLSANAFLKMFLWKSTGWNCHK